MHEDTQQSRPYHSALYNNIFSIEQDHAVAVGIQRLVGVALQRVLARLNNARHERERLPSRRHRHDGFQGDRYTERGLVSANVLIQRYLCFVIS